VTRTFLQGLAEFKVILELGPIFLLALCQFRIDHRRAVEMVTDGFTCPFILIDPFGNDIPGPLQGIFHALHLIAKKVGGRFLNVHLLLLHQDPGQWFQALVPSHRCPGLPLGLIGKVYVLQLDRI